jgi:hypothetical protein
MFFGVCWVGLDACWVWFWSDLEVQGDFWRHFGRLLGSFSISWEPVETKLQKVSQTAATDVFCEQNVCGRRLVRSRAKRVWRDRTKPTIFGAKLGSFPRPKFDTISKWFLDTCFSIRSSPLQPNELWSFILMCVFIHFEVGSINVDGIFDIILYIYIYVYIYIYIYIHMYIHTLQQSARPARMIVFLMYQKLTWRRVSG